MQRNDAIDIRRVANGFMVYPSRIHEAFASVHSEIHVFKTLSELCFWMNDHFSIEIVPVKSDTARVLQNEK